MSSPVTADVYRWADGALHLLDYCDMTESSIEAADSWRTVNGRTLALDLHRTRFLTAIAGDRYRLTDPDAFWDASIAAIPRSGEWFPRVEVHSGPRLFFRLRSAPERRQSVVLATHHGPDPRHSPAVKGPDLDALSRVRTSVHASGADEAVILTSDGYVIEASQSALVWWRGSILCTAPADFARVSSVTEKSLFALAGALGVELHREAVTPAELDGVELWALNALHGVRIATRWLDGPELAELPGRLSLWRDRLTALAHELPEPVAT